MLLRSQETFEKIYLQSDTENVDEGTRLSAMKNTVFGIRIGALVPGAISLLAKHRLHLAPLRGGQLPVHPIRSGTAV